MFAISSTRTSHANTAGTPSAKESPTCPPASARFTTPLPRALRHSADTLGWDAFCALHSGAPAAGADQLRIGSWESTPAHDDLVDHRATIAIGHRIGAVTSRALGPLAALSDMLHSLGVSTEITGLHHQQVGGRDGTTDVVVFIECDIDGNRAWGMGVARAAEGAGVAAMIAAVNRLR